VAVVFDLVEDYEHKPLIVKLIEQRISFDEGMIPEDGHEAIVDLVQRQLTRVLGSDDLEEFLVAREAVYVVQTLEDILHGMGVIVGA
jgi:hypothetical protein